MMTENHPTICRHEIFAVVSDDRRGGAFVIQHQHFRREPLAIKTVADGKRAQSGDNYPKRADLFPARKRQNTNSGQAKNCDRNPEQLFPKSHSDSNLLEPFNRASSLWVAHASRVQLPVRLGPIASRDRELFERRFWRAAKTSTRDACATQIPDCRALVLISPVVR